MNCRMRHEHFLSAANSWAQGTMNIFRPSGRDDRPLIVLKRRISLALVIAAVLAGMACHGPVERASRIRVGHEITPQPVRVGTVTVNFSLADAAEKPLTGAVVTVEADMSHAGMSPVFADAKEIGAGRYQSHVTLGMAGDWVILLHGTMAGGGKLEQQFDVNDVRPD
jgi:hypothetical protein